MYYIHKFIRMYLHMDYGLLETVKVAYGGWRVVGGGYRRGKVPEVTLQRSPGWRIGGKYSRRHRNVHTTI